MNAELIDQLNRIEAKLDALLAALAEDDAPPTPVVDLDGRRISLDSTNAPSLDD